MDGWMYVCMYVCMYVYIAKDAGLLSHAAALAKDRLGKRNRREEGQSQI